MYKIFFVIFSLQLFIALNCQTLPKEFKKCRYGENKCIVRFLNDIIKNYPKGIPSIGLKPLDVVDIKDSDVWNNVAIGAVWFNFKLFNQVNYGFENTTIKSIKGFGKDPTAAVMEINGEIPSLKHKGNFKAKGSVWLLKVNATGSIKSDFQNFRFNLKLKVIPEYRNNKRYVKIYELVPRVSMSRWISQLDNIFPDNLDLTIHMNELLNKNWLQFWNEMEPSFIRIFSTVFTSMIEDIFQRIPYDEMFLEDTETEI